MGIINNLRRNLPFAFYYLFVSRTDSASRFVANDKLPSLRAK